MKYGTKKSYDRGALFLWQVDFTETKQAIYNYRSVKLYLKQIVLIQRLRIVKSL